MPSEMADWHVNLVNYFSYDTLTASVCKLKMLTDSKINHFYAHWTTKVLLLFHAILALIEPAQVQ